MVADDLKAKLTGVAASVNFARTASSGANLVGEVPTAPLAARAESGSHERRTRDKRRAKHDLAERSLIEPTVQREAGPRIRSVRQPAKSKFGRRARSWFGLYFARRTICYNGSMTKDQVKDILDRVLSWPPEDQEKVARFAQQVEALRGVDDITDEEWAIIEARAARRDLASDEEVEKLFARYRGA